MWSRWAELWTDPESVTRWWRHETAAPDRCVHEVLSDLRSVLVQRRQFFHHVASSLSDEAVTCRCGRHAELLAYADVCKCSWCTDFIPESTLRTDSSRICEDVEDMMFCRSQWGTLFGDCSTVCRCRCLHIGEQLMMFLYLIMWRTCWKITSQLLLHLFFPLKSTLRRVASNLKWVRNIEEILKCLSLFLGCSIVL